MHIDQNIICLEDLYAEICTTETLLVHIIKC